MHLGTSGTSFANKNFCGNQRQNLRRKSADVHNIIMLDIDLLLGKRTLDELKNIVEHESLN